MEPEVWRRVVVCPKMTLFDLHRLIQWLGWSDEHLWAFRDPRTGASLGELPGKGAVRRAPDARRVTLEQCAWGDGLLYEYDFGDGWLHDIQREASLRFKDPFEPWLHSGAHPFPPEDCGGPPGYARLQAFWRERKDVHGDADYEEWAAGFDPEAFDLGTARSEFAPLSSSNMAALNEVFVPVVKAVGKRAALVDDILIHDLQRRLRKTLDEFDRDHGVHTTMGTATYNREHGSMTLETAVIREDGVVMNREASTYLLRAREYGLSPDWLGEPFMCGGDHVRITGLKPRARESVILQSLPEPGQPMQRFAMHPERVASHFKKA